jgi:hypothetical protein
MLPETQTVYSEVSVCCWRKKVGTKGLSKKRHSKFMRARSFNHELQLLEKLSAKKVSVLYIPNRQYYSLKFQRMYANSIMKNKHMVLSACCLANNFQQTDG